MGQRAVEQTLGRLLTDEEFRGAFERDPARTATAAGFELTEVELAALAAVPSGAVASWSEHLDGRIRRLHCPRPPGDV